MAVAVSCVLALQACGSLTPGDDVTGARTFTAQALERVNAFRAANGETPLSVSRSAEKAALEQAGTMAAHRAMDHTIGLGASFPRRMKRAGVALPAAENIAAGQKTVERAVAAWETSPHHRRNMLDSRFKSLGIAVAVNAETGKPYWSMVLTGR